MNLDQFMKVYKEPLYSDDLKAIYKSCDFPIWIRQECNEMFHKHQWEPVLEMSKSTVTEEQQCAMEYAKDLYHTLLKDCDAHLTALNNDLEKVKARKVIYHHLQERYSQCPMNLVEALVCCRNKEICLWKEYSSVQENESTVINVKMDTTDDAQPGNSTPSVFKSLDVPDDNLQLKIVHLKSIVDKIESDLKQTQKLVDNYKVDHTAMQDNESCLGEEEKRQWRTVTEGVLEARANLVSSIKRSEMMATELLPLLNTNIVDWKDRQKMCFLNLDEEPAVKELSQYCSDVGKKLYAMIEVCDRCEIFQMWTDILEGEDKNVNRAQINDIIRLKQEFMTKLENLIQRSTIQVQQPPPIINVSSSPHFAASIRILGLEKIPIQGAFPINVDLSSEMKLNNREQNKKTTFKLQNDQSFLAKKSSINEEVVAEFTSLQVREFKRPKRSRKKTPTGGDNLFVCEEKFRLVFTGVFSLPPYIRKVSLRTVSLPVTLTTNSSQFSDCHAAQLWQCWSTPADNDHGPYDFPTELPWSQVEAMLNKKIEKQTGLGLPKDQLQFLADKLSGEEEGQTNYETFIVTWNRFAKDKIDGKFSFWRWFHACVNLLQHNLTREWKDGRIYGFISKKKAKKLLRTYGPGVFLLRFSESTINESGPYITGSVSPVVISKVIVNGEAKKRIEHIDPYTTKQIRMKGSLGQVLATTDDAELEYLYPDKIPLKDAFEAYNDSNGDQDPQEERKGIYVGRTIHFKLRRLKITNDDEDDDSDCDDSEYNSASPFSAFSPSSTINPASVSSLVSTDQPFSPEQSSLPLPSPRMVQQQGSLLTELLSKDIHVPAEFAQSPIDSQSVDPSLSSPYSQPMDHEFSQVEFVPLPIDTQSEDPSQQHDIQFPPDALSKIEEILEADLRLEELSVAL